MMNEQERKALVEAANDGRYSGSLGCKLNGYCCNVAGYSQPYATITPCSGGSYYADWETVKRVVEGDRQFSNLAQVGWGWLGLGCNRGWRYCDSKVK